MSKTERMACVFDQFFFKEKSGRGAALSIILFVPEVAHGRFPTLTL
jgi:hypothetical protein